MTYYDDELYHFGIKGMKWGVRRYQNKDGSLTAAGRKRQNSTHKRKWSKKEKTRYCWSGNSSCYISWLWSFESNW